MTGVHFDRTSGGNRPAPFDLHSHNRTSSLLVLLRSIEEQTFREVEICISDGGSDDGRMNEILSTLQNGTLPFRYARVENQVPYDANLRSSVRLALGRYCLLSGTMTLSLNESHSQI